MFLTPSAFSAEGGVLWEVMIEVRERLMMAVAKIEEARELGCDRVRVEEWAPR